MIEALQFDCLSSHINNAWSFSLLFFFFFCDKVVCVILIPSQEKKTFTFTFLDRWRPLVATKYNSHKGGSKGKWYM